MSFVNTAQKSDATAQLMFDVVKYIIDVKIAERDANAAAERAIKKQAILAAIAQKEDEELLGKSVEDLRKLAESL